MQTFSVIYALIFSNGGLVIIFHNKIRDKIIHLTRKAFSPNYVCGESLIHLVRSRSEEQVRHGGRFPETMGDVSTQGLWESQTEVIIDIWFGDSDAYTWKLEGMDKILARWEKINMDKHRQH